MRKLALVVSALFLLGSASACGTSGTSDADKSTTTIADGTTTTTAGDDGDTTTTVDDDSDGPTTTVGGEDADTDDYVAALVENLEGNEVANDEMQFSGEQATCTATEWVDIIGVDTFSANGVTPDMLGESGFDFSELGIDKGQATAMVEALGGCGLDAVATLRKALAGAYDATQQKCLDAELEDQTIVDLLVDTLYLGGQGDDVTPELDRIDEVCKLKA